MDEVHVNQYIK